MVTCRPGAALTIVRMPLSYTAFRAHKQDLYHQYARIRVGDAVSARRLVQDVFGDLAMSWAQVLSSRSPAAASWQLLTTRAARTVARPLRAPYGVLAEEEADAVVVRYRLGLPADAAAELMGVDEFVLTGRLQAALRAFR